ncbi:DJ-1/PfpI family protein, partial [Halorubrum lacusprofundi]|uniref:DJ-1/PfpI family protein n=1 Tax=Halorubrum lacusprofundi TaxID=2247 RepID=UPI0014828AAF
MTGQQILMIVGDVGEDYEIMVPFQALQAVGHEVHAVCPEKEDGETGKTAIHDFRGDQTYLETRGNDFALTHALDTLDTPDADATVLPAGPSYTLLHGAAHSLATVYAVFVADLLTA